jgi:hypothetical protein
MVYNPRWVRWPSDHPAAETWQRECCEASVVQAFTGDPEKLAADQLAHALAQQLIQSTYPGRGK